ncbi:hypothetical protein B0A52_03695 [Exophiala mesophila]|uniref:Pal1 cell morphology protein n=1 Tax=Exophiala mesophila TaxID=212818 RepID=A0A438N9Q5_EXOME|nr:hypothetical protein B0A52_03695 [Exophiala mesophila]
MEPTSDKNWAAHYLLDPLTAPEPSQETGPGTTLRPGATVAPVKPPPSEPSPGRRLSKNNPYRKISNSSTGTADIRRSVSLNNHSNNPFQATPPQSPEFIRSPHSPRSPDHRQEAFGQNGGGGRRRGSSLNERYPGDKSHRPLDTLTREKHSADRSRHMTKKHHIRPDTIDNLDSTGLGTYHHGGPYDATLFARNNSSNSPLAALADSNAEALKATPREKIIDSVQHHRPLDGVAAHAPGQYDRNGNLYTYEEGENMMVDLAPGGGSYKRWPGVQYHPDDIKGKGEPSYSIEKALKEHKLDDSRNGENGIEMKTHGRSTSGGSGAMASTGMENGHTGLGRSDSGSMGKRLSGGLKKRFGSLKKKNHAE